MIGPPVVAAIAPDHARTGDLETVARTFAARQAKEAEAAIAALAADAIRRWRLDEATFWQRVKFRARLLRAARDGAAWQRTGEK